MSERLTTPEVDAALNETYEALGVTRAGLAGLREVARSVASLRADARLGAALREALASAPANSLHIWLPGCEVTMWGETPSGASTTTLYNDATRALSALLAARTPTPETEER
jgi:hypothetical protein